MRTSGRSLAVTIALSALVTSLLGLGLAAPAHAAGPPTSVPAKSKGAAKPCSGIRKVLHLC